MKMRRITQIALTSLVLATPAFAQQTTQIERPQPGPNGQLIATGCLMKEMDYRKAHQAMKGAFGGLGLGDEFVLVENGCNEVGKGPAYRLTGKHEDELKRLVGRRVEVTGSWDKPHDVKAAAGQRATTLPPEFRIASFREAPEPVSPAPVAAAVAPAAPAPVAEARPAPVAAAAPVSVEARNEAPAPELPKTASNLPLVGLIGLLSLAGGLALQLKRFVA